MIPYIFIYNEVLWAITNTWIFYIIMIKCRLIFKLDALSKEILGIAIPSALAVAADPIASLIDTAFIGHLGIYSLPSHINFIAVWNLIYDC